MIPILYGSVGGEITSTVEAYLQTQGIGPLPDCPEGVVIEERNGQYELEMTYPITGRHYTDIAISCCIKVVPFVNGTPQLFEIYRMTKPINGRVKIYGRHIGYRLSYNTVTPFSLSNCTAAQAFAGLKSHAVEDCPFTFWTDFSGTAVSFKIGEPMSFRSCLGGTEGSILDLWSGEYEWDNFTVKFHNGRGTDNGVSLRYGKNITDLTQDENIENTITGIVPFWKGYDDTGSEVIVSCGPVYSANADRFSFKRTVPHDFSPDFSEAPTVQLLQQTAQAWVTNNKIGEPEVDLTVSFVQLADTTDYKNLKVLETVNLCDTVHVEFPELGVSATSKVIRTEYDFTKDRYKSITLGSTKASNLVKTLQEITVGPALEEVEKGQTVLEQAIANVTKAIRGSNGGYVKMLDTNGDGYTDEIVILDAESNGVLEDATNVWRFNNQGLGFSSNGYMGPYRTALTSGDSETDPGIVADAIVTGILNASLIKAGVLQSQDANASFSLDLLTGTVNLANAYITGGTIRIKTSSDEDDMIRLEGTLSRASHMVNGYYTINYSNAVNPNTYSTLQGAGLFFKKSSGDGKTLASTDQVISSYIGNIIRLYDATGAASKVGLTAGVSDSDHRAYVSINDTSRTDPLLLATMWGASDGGHINVYKNDPDARTVTEYLHWGMRAHDDDGNFATFEAPGVTFYDSTSNVKSRMYSNPENNAKILGRNTSSSWLYVTRSDMHIYRAFVLVACRGAAADGTGAMASTYIPYELARLCNSTSNETWVQSAQNSVYSGRCYFDFTNNRIYLVSSGNADCVVKIYGIT